MAAGSNGCFAARGAGFEWRGAADEAGAGCSISRRATVRPQTRRWTSWRPPCCARKRFERTLASRRFRCGGRWNDVRVDSGPPGHAHGARRAFDVRNPLESHTFTRETNSRAPPPNTRCAPCEPISPDMRGRSPPAIAPACRGPGAAIYTLFEGARSTQTPAPPPRPPLLFTYCPHVACA